MTTGTMQLEHDDGIMIEWHTRERRMPPMIMAYDADDATICLTPAEARIFAQMLVEAADKAEGKE